MSPYLNVFTDLKHCHNHLQLFERFYLIPNKLGLSKKKEFVQGSLARKFCTEYPINMGTVPLKEEEEDNRWPFHKHKKAPMLRMRNAL